jgi:hypothetical protein
MMSVSAQNVTVTPERARPEPELLARDLQVARRRQNRSNSTAPATIKVSPLD